MTKITYIIGLILSLSLSVHSQDTEVNSFIVEYDIYYNTEYPITKTGKLIVDKQQKESIFISNKNTSTKSNNGNTNDDGNMILELSSIKKFNYFNFESNELISKEKVIFDTFLVKEKISEFNWVLESETKEIDGISVKKATTTFRGRKYIAWYSISYPIRSGPWKFHGLPGLIIDIYDETKRYQWTVKNIKTEKVDTNIFTLNTKKIKEITIREYADALYKNDIDLRLTTKLPREMKIKSQKTTRPKQRTRKEILFEWEDVKGINEED